MVSGGELKKMRVEIKRSRERVEITERVGKKETDEQRNSDAGEKVL